MASISCWLRTFSIIVDLSIFDLSVTVISKRLSPSGVSAGRGGAGQPATGVHELLHPRPQPHYSQRVHLGNPILQCPARRRLLSWLILRSSRARAPAVPSPEARQSPGPAGLSSPSAGSARTECLRERWAGNRTSLLPCRPKETPPAGCPLRARRVRPAAVETA